MLQWLVWVLAAAVAAPKSDAPEGPALPVLSAPSAPLDGISPHASQAPEPPVTGGGSELDLERLARVQTSFRIGVDASALTAVDAASAIAIARHLATDPRWRVMERDGVLMAAERRSRGKERSVLWHGFHLYPREALRVAVRFADWPTDAPYATSPFVSRVAASNPEMTVKAFVLSGDWAGWTATALCVEADHLALDIYEARPSKERPHTIQALSMTLPLLEGLADASATIEAKGYVPWYLPTGEPIRERSPPEVNSHGRGLLEIRARLNPGASGWTWARILDSDLEAWEERAVAAGTRERVGWSAEPVEQFYFQSAFPVPRGKQFSGSVEFWFQPDAGGPPTRLDATPITIPKR